MLLLQGQVIAVHLKLKHNMIWQFHIINAAKKFEQKEKLEKAKKRYEKAQKLLIKV